MCPVTINSMCTQSHSVLAVLTLLIGDPICLKYCVECYSTQEEKGLLEPTVVAWNGDPCRDILVQLVPQMHDQWQIWIVEYCVPDEGKNKMFYALK